MILGEVIESDINPSTSSDPSARRREVRVVSEATSLQHTHCTALVLFVKQTNGFIMVDVNELLNETGVPRLCDQVSVALQGHLVVRDVRDDGEFNGLVLVHLGAAPEEADKVAINVLRQEANEHIHAVVEEDCDGDNGSGIEPAEAG